MTISLRVAGRKHIGGCVLVFNLCQVIADIVGTRIERSDLSTEIQTMGGFWFPPSPKPEQIWSGYERRT
jgi:hypothetical protein